MGFRKIKEKYLYKKLQKELCLLPDSRTPNTKEINAVAILTTNRLSYDLAIVDALKKSIHTIRNVHIYSFRDFKKEDAISYKHFSEKDIDWKGNIKDVSFDSFIETSFDLLIGYFNTNNLYLEYAALKSKATFKVGFANVNDKIFDIVIAETDAYKIENFILVAKQYLELLKKI